MRRYDIVSGILLILSIIDFALAAPVLVQEKRQACVDVVHIPRAVITVLGKRGPGDEDLDKLPNLAKEFFETWKNPVESSDAHAPSSSAPPGPDPGSTNVVSAPAPNPAPSTANPILSIELSSTPWTASSDSENFEWLVEHEGDDELHGSLDTPTSSGYGFDHELTGAHAPQPNPNKRPWTDPDPDFDWNYWTYLEDPPPRPAKLPKLEESGQANEYQVEHGHQPDRGPSTDSDFGWNHYPVPLSVAHPPSTSAGLPTEPEHEVGTPPPPIPGSADPELPSDHQSLSTDSESQPEDLQAAIYAAKGKAKVPRSISGTTRDVGNAAQR
jgi:hypothetical protein